MDNDGFRMITKVISCNSFIIIILNFISIKIIGRKSRCKNLVPPIEGKVQFVYVSSTRGQVTLLAIRAIDCTLSIARNIFHYHPWMLHGVAGTYRGILKQTNNFSYVLQESKTLIYPKQFQILSFINIANSKKMECRKILRGRISYQSLKIKSTSFQAAISWTKSAVFDTKVLRYIL